MVFERAWICAGRVSDVTQPGDWVRAEVAGQDVVVMRGEDLELRAFYNVCLHRGTPLLDGAAGRTTRIVCPYHGWSYATDGRLLLKLSLDDLLPQSPRASRLPSVRLATWRGFVFVCLDAKTPALEDWMGEVPPWIDTELLKRARMVSYEIAADWRLVVANFQESHHFPLVHPELEQLTPTRRARSFFRSGSRWLGGEMDLVDRTRETVSMSGRFCGRPLLVQSSEARKVCDAMLFPSMLTSLQPDYFLTYRLVPRGQVTGMIAETFVHPTTPAEADLEDVFAFWDRVNAQDKAICERQQRGVRSRGFAGPMYLTEDEGIVAFEELLGK